MSRSRLIALLFVAVVIAFIWTVARQYRASTQIAREIEAIRAEGYPVGALELHAWFPGVPPEENPMPLYLEAHYAFVDRPVNFVGIPYMDTNTPDLPAGETYPKEAVRKLGEFVEAYRDALELVRRAAGLYKARPVDFYGANSISINELGRNALRSAATMANLEFRHATETGDAEGAVVAFEAGCAACAFFSFDPSIISRLEQYNCVEIALRDFSRFFRPGDLDDSKLARMDRSLVMLDSEGLLERALAVDRGWGASYVERLLDGESLGGPHDDPAPAGTAEWFYKVVDEFPARAAMRTGTLPRIWLGELRVSRRFFDSLRLPYPEGSSVRAQIKMDLDGLHSSRALYMYQGIVVEDTWFRLADWEEPENNAWVRAARTAIAIERYRLAEGRLPTALADLVPRFLPELPLDPFDATPLKYVVKGAGYDIYSIGKNLRDDGGVGDANRKTDDLGHRIDP